MDIVAEIEIDEMKYWDFPHSTESSASEFAFSGLVGPSLRKNRRSLSLNLPTYPPTHLFTYPPTHLPTYPP